MTSVTAAVQAASLVSGEASMGRSPMAAQFFLLGFGFVLLMAGILAAGSEYEFDQLA